MKSAHRHELQTNALAQRLEVAVERLRPYVSTIAGVILVVAVLLLIWQYASRSTTATQEEAWNAFNEAIGSAPPDLNGLNQTAQEYPGTKMKSLADISWAEGQTFLAAQNFIYNRRAAEQALDAATSGFSSVLQTSSNERLLNRAHLGMARVYEMRNDLEKARDEYNKVTGGFEEYAKEQVKRLEKPQAAELYAWLEKAEPPRVQAPPGPGTPGQRPGFSEGDLTMPTEGPSAISPGTTTEPGPSFEELLKGLGELPSETGERYEGEPQTPPPTGPPVTTEGATPPTSTPPTATEGASAEGTPAPTTKSGEGEKSTENTAPPVEENTTPPTND